MLSEGSAAPGFTLPGTDESDAGVDEYSLADALADGPALLNFYLFDFHPQCTDHVCSPHDVAWFDLDERLSVYGISTDRTFSHAAFARQEGLQFPLLSDSDGEVAEDYGVLYDEFQGHKRIARRAVFPVDTDDPGVQPDWQAVQAAVRDLEVTGSVGSTR